VTVLGVPQLDLATPAHFGRAQAAQRLHGASGELLPEGAASKTRTLYWGSSTPRQPWMIRTPRRKVPFGQDLGRILAFAAVRAARPGAGAVVQGLDDGAPPARRFRTDPLPAASRRSLQGARLLASVLRR